MKYPGEDLDEIENTYLEGRQLSATQEKRALEALDSTSARDAITGAIALLCSRSCGTENQLKARKRLDALCKSAFDIEQPWLVDLLFSLLQIPIQALAASPSMHKLANRALAFPRVSARANALLVLERLAKSGDAEAVNSIRLALTDSDHAVRTNAMVALRNIGIT